MIMRQLWVSMLTQSHTCALLVLTLFEVAGEGSSRGPSYDAEPHHCNDDTSCETRLGHTCVQLYQGCRMGQCMCDPLNYTADKMGSCRPKKLGGERCSNEDKCPDRMACLSGRCACVIGSMTSDLQFCREENYRLLGERCRPNDICYHISSTTNDVKYSDNDVVCSARGHCVCRKGFKRDSMSCKNWAIGEYGCKKDHQCGRGAMCIRGQCKCPQNFMPVAQNTKCAPKTAITELGYGEHCEEIKEQTRFCKAGLICQMCGEDFVSRCVRFTMRSRFQESSPLRGNAQSAPSPLLYAILLCVTSSYLVLFVR